MIYWYANISPLWQEVSVEYPYDTLRCAKAHGPLVELGNEIHHGGKMNSSLSESKPLNYVIQCNKDYFVFVARWFIYPQTKVLPYTMKA